MLCKECIECSHVSYSWHFLPNKKELSNTFYAVHIYAIYFTKWRCRCIAARIYPPSLAPIFFYSVAVKYIEAIYFAFLMGLFNQGVQIGERKRKQATIKEKWKHNVVCYDMFLFSNELLYAFVLYIYNTYIYLCSYVLFFLHKFVRNTYIWKRKWADLFIFIEC